MNLDIRHINKYVKGIYFLLCRISIFANIKKDHFQNKDFENDLVSMIKKFVQEE